MISVTLILSFKSTHILYHRVESRGNPEFSIDFSTAVFCTFIHLLLSVDISSVTEDQQFLSDKEQRINCIKSFIQAKSFLEWFSQNYVLILYIIGSTPRCKYLSATRSQFERVNSLSLTIALVCYVSLTLRIQV